MQSYVVVRTSKETALDSHSARESMRHCRAFGACESNINHPPLAPRPPANDIMPSVTTTPLGLSLSSSAAMSPIVAVPATPYSEHCHEDVVYVRSKKGSAKRISDASSDLSFPRLTHIEAPVCKTSSASIGLASAYVQAARTAHEVHAWLPP